jgi:peptide/nickel transport system substrate-binding protein
VLLLLVAGWVAVAMGCGSGTPDDGSSGGKDLTVAIGAEPTNMDTLVADSGQRDVFSRSVQEGLTVFKDGKVQPLLATSWKQQDGGYAFKLREGVKFHDGSTLDADDVVASFKRMLDPNLEGWLSFFDLDTEVTALDPMTVLIKRPKEDPSLLARTTQVMIMPAEWANPDDQRAKDAIMGTGPYKFDSWKKGQQIELSAFPDYWGQKGQVQHVVVKFMPEEATRLAALQAGEVQIAVDMSPDNQGQAPKLVASPSAEVLILMLNTEHGPFTDPRVREAADLAINRDQIIKTIYGGSARAANGQPVPDYVVGASKQVQTMPYDPARAKQLLQEAGATGAPITLATTTGRWVKDAQVAAAIGQMLDAVGFKSKVETQEYTKWVQTLIGMPKTPAKGPDAIPFNHSDEIFDAVKVSTAMFCDGVTGAYCNDDIERLRKQVSTELDPAKRQALFDELWKNNQDNHGVISVAEVLKSIFTADNIEFDPYPDSLLRFNTIKVS